MDTTEMRTTATEDRQGKEILREALVDARAVGEGELDEAYFPKEVKLWNDLLWVLGAST